MLSSPCFCANPVERLGERVGELLDALALQRVRDVVVVDARLGQLGEELLRLLYAFLERQRHVAVVLEGR